MIPASRQARRNPRRAGMGVRWEAVPPQAAGEGHVQVGGGAKGRGAVRKGLGGARSGAKSKWRERRGRGEGRG